MVGDAQATADTYTSNKKEGIRLHAGDMLTLPISSTDNISIRAGDTSQKFNEYFTLIDEAAKIFGTSLDGLKQRLEDVARAAGVSPLAPTRWNNKG